MIKVFLIVNLALAAGAMCGQKYEIGHAQWADSLRNYLVLDTVYCRDSVLSFDAYGSKIEIAIAKKRPLFYKAHQILDTISGSLDNDTTFARLVTILNEYDVKYLNEFQFNVDYFLSAYHEFSFSHNKYYSDFGLIGKMESLLLLEKMGRDSSFSLVRFLISPKTKLWKENDPYSTSWERWGYLDMDIFLNFYFKNQQLYESDLRDQLTVDRPVQDYYAICYKFKLFDRLDENNISCDRIEKLINEKTSENFIRALINLNKYHHGDSCLNDLLSDF